MTSHQKRAVWAAEGASGTRAKFDAAQQTAANVELAHEFSVTATGEGGEGSDSAIPGKAPTARRKIRPKAGLPPTECTFSKFTTLAANERRSPLAEEEPSPPDGCPFPPLH